MYEDLEHKGHWFADEDKVIVPKIREDNEQGTKSIWLGKFDSIDNYEEIEVNDNLLKGY